MTLRRSLLSPSNFLWRASNNYYKIISRGSFQSICLRECGDKRHKVPMAVSVETIPVDDAVAEVAAETGLQAWDLQTHLPAPSAGPGQRRLPARIHRAVRSERIQGRHSIGRLGN